MTNKAKSSQAAKTDDFASVARRLECDPDLDKFDAKLKRIAPKPKPPKSREP